jgi:hypothetical protein
MYQGENNVRNELPRSKLRGIPAGKKNASQQAAGYLPGKE